MKIIISSFSPFNGAFFITTNLLRISPSLKTMNNLLDSDHNDDDTDDDCLEVMKSEIKNLKSIKNVLIINGRYKFEIKRGLESMPIIFKL